MSGTGSVGAPATTSVESMPALSLDLLLTLEHEGWRALCEPGQGARFYDGLMTDDGVMVLAGGIVLDRAAVAATLAESPPWADYEITQARVVGLGGAAAALVYYATATRAGAEPFSAHMSSTYRIVDGRPRLALYQQTPGG